MRKLLRILFAVSIPSLGIIYGYGDHVGWWDNLFGRRTALIALEKLSTAKGVPDILLYDDQAGFKPLWKFILRGSVNDYLRELAKQGKQPNCIVRIGMIDEPAIGTALPPDTPVSGRAPETTPLLAVYGYARYPAKENESSGKANYACTLGDLRKWIDDSRNRERFCVTVLLIGILSIVLIILDVNKAKKRQTQSPPPPRC
jgi:hypothetical protein